MRPMFDENRRAEGLSDFKLSIAGGRQGEVIQHGTKEPFRGVGRSRVRATKICWGRPSFDTYLSMQRTPLLHDLCGQV